MTVWHAAAGKAVSITLGRRLARALRMSLAELLDRGEESAVGGQDQAVGAVRASDVMRMTGLPKGVAHEP
jgi:hypothetical protein